MDKLVDYNLKKRSKTNDGTVMDNQKVIDKIFY